MAIEADIVTYLDSNTSLTAGTDLFEGPIPELPDVAVGVVYHTPLRSDDYAMGPSLSAPASEIGRFQVMTRNTTRAAAITRANEIHALLDNLQNTTINGRAYFHILGDGEPAFLSQDNNLRWRYIADYEFRKVRG